MDSILNILATIDEFPEERVRDFGQPVKPEDVMIPGEVSLRAKKLDAVISELADKLEARRVSLEHNILHSNDLMKVLLGARKEMESFMNDMEAFRLLLKVFDREVRTNLNIPAGQHYAIVADWKVIEDKPEAGAITQFERAVMETDCGDPGCIIHGHLHEQTPEKPAAPAESKGETDECPIKPETAS